SAPSAPAGPRAPSAPSVPSLPAGPWGPSGPGVSSISSTLVRTSLRASTMVLWSAMWVSAPSVAVPGRVVVQVAIQVSSVGGLVLGLVVARHVGRLGELVPVEVGGEVDPGLRIVEDVLGDLVDGAHASSSVVDCFFRSASSASARASARIARWVSLAISAL